MARAAQRCAATSNTQMGAQQHNSAIDALLHTIDPIIKHISATAEGTRNKKPPRPTLLAHDIDGAFNNTNPRLLLQVMKQRQMPTYLTNWTSAFTTDRQIAFGFDQRTEQPQPFTSDLPQGSPLSPVLFLIHANAMLDLQHHAITEPMTSYVDDISMVQISSTTKRATQRLAERTNHQLERATHLNLTYSANKTEMMHCFPPKSKRRLQGEAA